MANLHLPAREGGPWPCVVLLHGGFWRTGWDRTLMTALAADLARRGIAAWNVEYRRVGQDGGGWPGTFEDVAAAVDRLAEVDEVDAARVATCGHSAGGHLALWLAARHRLPDEAPGAEPRVRPVAAIAQAAVCDLERAWRDDLGGGAVAGLLGSFEDEPDRYAAASPAALAPVGVAAAPRPRQRRRDRPGVAEPRLRRSGPGRRGARRPGSRPLRRDRRRSRRVGGRGRLALRPSRSGRPSRNPVGPSRTVSVDQDLPPPARNCSQASLIRSACPCVNMSMQVSCV